MRDAAVRAEERVRAASLIGILTLARALGLAGRELPLSIWLPSVLLWQDVAVGVIFWLADRRLRRSRLAWTAYWIIVVWTAVNVVVVRTLSSPVTVPMLRATGGPLADSIAHYLTPGNLAIVAFVITAGAVVPRVSIPTRLGKVAVIAAIAIALPGPFVASRVDTRGAQWNAVTALVATSLPRVAFRAVASNVDWRVSPFGVPPGDDLSRLQGTAAGRNVVMVVLESTGSRYLRTYGAPDDPMPSLTALAGESLQFDSAYAVYPESIKGLFAVLCSRDPAFDVAVGVHAAAPCTPLARVLADVGYRSALFHSGRFAYLGMDTLLARQGFDTLEDAGNIGGQIESSFGVDEPSTVARILSWIDGQDRSRPFFVTYLPVAGHHPYATPDPGPFSGQGALSAYKNVLRYADESLKTLLDGLRSRGLNNKTMIVVFGDHGEAFGQHEGNFGHTLFAYDENVRVPLLISIPGVTTRPIRARQVASVIDLAPTILSLVGASVPDEYRGASLLSGQDRLAFFYTDYALGWVGLRDGCWKYLLELEANRSRLFDVCVDPDETVDRAGEHSDRVGAYHERAKDWISATRQTMREE